MRHLDLYRQMLLIRYAEQACSTLFAEGSIPGFIHLSIGQEAVSAGIMAALGHNDTVSSTHRGHGHALAKGLTLPSFFKELMGRADGACKGRGGSMHVADLKLGMLGANGIVGGGIGIALGSGLAHKLRGGDAVAVAFFGDGAMAEGILHECLNIASLLSLPVLFACEANGWSEFSPTNTQISFSLEALAGAYGISYHRINGNDVRVVAKSAEEIIRSMRQNRRPTVIECATRRVRGHFEGDPQKYRNEEDTALDPLTVMRDGLMAEGVAADQIEALEAKVTEAKQGAIPTLTSAAEEVYAVREVV
jgi:pyruvate dehydrogenase E1 component alpha subunit